MASDNSSTSSNKASIVVELQAVKRKSGKSYNQIAQETGLTNVYVAQLLRRQAQLKPETVPKLRAALPGLPGNLLDEMMLPPLRSYEPDLIQEPTVYRSHPFLIFLLLNLYLVCSIFGLNLFGGLVIMTMLTCVLGLLGLILKNEINQGCELMITFCVCVWVQSWLLMNVEEDVIRYRGRIQNKRTNCY